VYARIAKFEGVDPERYDAMRERIETEIDSPPPGLEGVREVLMLVDRESGTGLGLTFYESEDDLRRGDDALNAMTPNQGGGRRTDREIYEVALRATPGAARH
jgi:hypothetical protein